MLAVMNAAHRVIAWEDRIQPDCRDRGWSGCAYRRVSRRQLPCRRCRTPRSWRWRSRRPSRWRTRLAVGLAVRGVARGKPTRRTPRSSSAASRRRRQGSTSWRSKLHKFTVGSCCLSSELRRSGAEQLLSVSVNKARRELGRNPPACVNIIVSTVAAAAAAETVELSGRQARAAIVFSVTTALRRCIRRSETHYPRCFRCPILSIFLPRDAIAVRGTIQSPQCVHTALSLLFLPRFWSTDVRFPLPHPLKFWRPKTDQNLAFFPPNLTLSAPSFVRRQIFRKKMTFCQYKMFPYQMTGLPIWATFIANFLHCGVKFAPVLPRLRCSALSEDGYDTITMFAVLQSSAIYEWKWNNRVVGSSVAKWPTSPRRLVALWIVWLIDCVEIDGRIMEPFRKSQ